MHVAEILLTADRTLMNNFHLKGEFVSAWYGSADSFPWWLFKFMAREPKKDANHESVFAPYPLRKIQAKLIDAGFDAPIVSPEYLPKYIRSAKILGIHTINPLGSGTSPIFRQLLLNHGEYSVKYFQQLLESKVIQHARKNGLKIIVGGAGAWQFLNQPYLQKNSGLIVSSLVKLNVWFSISYRKGYKENHSHDTLNVAEKMFPTWWIFHVSKKHQIMDV
jgi:hypothetical protein